MRKSEYTKLPENLPKEIQFNSGVFTKTFNPEDGKITAPMFATSGGGTFKATPTLIDNGADIDNCPAGTWQMADIDSWEITMSGTAVSMTPETAKTFVTAGEEALGKVTAKNHLEEADFSDLWWVGGYGNGTGFMAIHLKHALSTDGFNLQTENKGKGKFGFAFKAHYDMSTPDEVPFEIYIKEGAGA